LGNKDETSITLHRINIDLKGRTPMLKADILVFKALSEGHVY